MSEQLIVELSIVDEECSLFALDSSYGASVIAICRDVEVRLVDAA